MATVIKNEWHQVVSKYELQIDLSLLEEIYPDLEDEELKAKMEEVESGNITVDELVGDALDADVSLEWEHCEDDWWTDRKGGYDVTYELLEE